ncbi:MAG: tRNA 5-methoxyuridine(34)/uridine 5-oxyacetic acid(34) synthase CmoB [Planctomycetaceae bacterium]|nr:tRNA 5-methoxyuridine(34)/uridine 5-oxyacetic acid(34) synthase CmoB [Planctomycetaceae bacterium]
MPDLELADVLDLRNLEATVRQELTQGVGADLMLALSKLPHLSIADRDCHEVVTARLTKRLGEIERKQLVDSLMQFAPWRKGPFQIGDVLIDAEWRSDWKWDRVFPHLPPLADQRVLDVGCGNGYYLYRLAAESPQVVAGIDPYARYLFQFIALQQYLCVENIRFLPVSLDRLPGLKQYFDLLLCMGVLYHQRSPLDFLTQLAGYLRPGGTLVIETLTIPGEESTALFPSGRYAKMRNCFFLPTSNCLQSWLVRAGFSQTRVVDEIVTTVEEQRSTTWMQFDSLADFLDPSDVSRTREGHPAPQRTTVLATR